MPQNMISLEIGAFANVFIEMMLYLTGTDSQYNMASDLKMRLPRTHVCIVDRGPKKKKVESG